MNRKYIQQRREAAEAEAKARSEKAETTQFFNRVREERRQVEVRQLGAAAARAQGVACPDPADPQIDCPEHLAAAFEPQPAPYRPKAKK